MAKTLPTRKDVPVEYTWRLEDIFATDEQWEQEFQQIQALLPKFSEYKGRLGKAHRCYTKRYNIATMCSCD